MTGLRDRRARGDRPDHPTPDHEHVFVRHAPFSDLVMPDGKAARTWMKCLGCPERREIVRSVK